MIRRVVCLLALAVVCLPGCGASKVEGVSAEQENLKVIALLYGQFVSVKGKPPANLDEFKKFLEATKSNPSAVVKVEGDIEQFLISPRDNKPYMFIWNVQAAVGKPDPIAYEQEGDGSSRLVAFGSGSVVELDPEQFKQLVPSAK